MSKAIISGLTPRTVGEIRYAVWVLGLGAVLTGRMFGVSHTHVGRVCKADSPIFPEQGPIEFDPLSDPRFSPDLIEEIARHLSRRRK